VLNLLSRISGLKMLDTRSLRTILTSEAFWLFIYNNSCSFRWVIDSVINDCFDRLKMNLAHMETIKLIFVTL